MVYKEKDVITRTEALMRAFGWQGGTVHQICDIIGLDVNDFLYGEEIESRIDHKKGSLAYRTCRKEFNELHIETYKGNLQFWLGVASGVQTSIKLKEATPRKF